MANIFQQQVVPQKPKVLSQERVFVYMPAASEDGKGLASFNPRDFNSPNGYASLRWPMEMLVETLADPLARPALTKVTEDEFLHTNNIVSVTNPVTGVIYSSDTAEVKLNRENRNALSRPDLVMLDQNDFEEVKVSGPNNEEYNLYKLKRNDPFVTPSLVKVNQEDFVKDEDTVEVSWPYAHNTALGTSKTNGYGLIRIDQNGQGNLSFNSDGNLEVDTEALKQNMSSYFATRPTYGESDITNWPDRDKYIDIDTGLAKRDSSGNTLIAIDKYAVGLSKVENIAFNERTYDMFGQAMKQYFEDRFGKKLDRSYWDGEAGLFRDWQPPSTDKNTVQKWFEILELEDNSIWSTIRTLNMFLGYYDTVAELLKTHTASATLFGNSAYVVETRSYYSIKPIDSTRYKYFYRDNTGLESITGQSVDDRAVNLNNGNEYVWNGTSWVVDGVHPEAWQWYNTNVQDLSFLDFVENDKSKLQPNAPVANVSVGRSGKWIQSDHIHPSDPSKMDADLIENATIDIITTVPGPNDFHIVLATKTILDKDLNEIQAIIVSTSEYLPGIVDPQTGDLAVTRNNGNIYEYNGESWVNTGELATIKYNANSTVNIPYVRTGQYLHNWKNAPTLFTQDANSNEGYWAGTEEEFENLDLNDLQGNFMFHVEDGEGLLPGDITTTQSIDEAGITLSTDEYISTDRLVIVDKGISLDNKVLTMRSEDAVPNEHGERRYLEPYNFGPVLTNPGSNARMAMVVTDTYGNTSLAHRSFAVNRIIQSDANGNLQASTKSPDSIVTSSVSLGLNKVILGNGDKTLTTFDSGNIGDKPIVANGNGSIKTLNLTPNRTIVTNANGGLSSASWLNENILKSSNGITQSILADNKVILSGGSNTVKTWSTPNSVAGSLVIRGSNDGEITTKLWNANNRLLYSAPNGTIDEIGLGTPGQYLVSSGDGIPGWADGPKDKFTLPQTFLTTNPSETEANNFKGLVAILLDYTPEVTELRNNCIYYY